MDSDLRREYERLLQRYDRMLLWAGYLETRLAKLENRLERPHSCRSPVSTQSSYTSFSPSPLDSSGQN